MKKKLLIIGASGHGKVVADIAIKMGKWESIAFLDDDESIKSSMGIKVIGTSNQVTNYIDDYEVVVAIGNNVTREKIHDKLESLGVKIPVLIHPNAVIGEHVDLGLGTVVMAGVVINSCTHVGKGCIINTGATIDHDNIIEDFVHISPGTHLAGNVTIGKGSWIGIGSSVINNITIPSGCIVGAGSIVVKDLPAKCTAVGVPAKPIKYQK